MIELGRKYGCLTVLSEAIYTDGIVLYHCRCKCGKENDVSENVLLKKPSYCFRPVYCADNYQSQHSSAGSYANSRQWERCLNDETILPVSNKDEIKPNPMYCDIWNREKEKEIQKELENVPRVYAPNYDIDFTGTIYESLEVLECTNSNLEYIERSRRSNQRKFRPSKIIIYKEYRCRCYLCGRELMTTCDKFGIYPPTQYGYRAYDGYWSAVKCDCHPISSFQWIVNKILLENNIPYRVEVAMPDLYGVGGGHLRFDFGIIDPQTNTYKCFIECQGEQHFEPVRFDSSSSDFEVIQQHEITVQHDTMKVKYAEDHNIPLIRILYKDKTLDKIKAILKFYDII